MKNTITYRDYIGSVEFSEEDMIFYGKVLGVKALISYEGKNAKELVKDFHNAIDLYLDTCMKKKQEPEKAYKGSFNVRISPELHQKIALCALSQGTTLNNFVCTALTKAVES